MKDLFNLDEREVKLFAVFKKENPSKILTITVRKREAVEYALKLLRLEHLSHFQAWCRLRGHDINDSEAWDKYFTDCISDAEKESYVISKISYTTKDVAAIIRMFGGFAPLGCSYDLPVEYDYHKAQTQLSDYEVEFKKSWKSKQETSDGK